MTTHEVEEMLDITKKTLIYYENEESHFVYHLILNDIIIQLQ